MVGTQAWLRTQRLHTPLALRTRVLRVIPKFRRSARRDVGEVLDFKAPTLVAVSQFWSIVCGSEHQKGVSVTKVVEWRGWWVQI